MIRRPLALFALAAALSAPVVARASTCAPVRIGPHVMLQPEPWRHAIEALIRSTAEEGLPWACGGGEVDLVVGPEGGTLTIIDAKGRAISRDVATPDDVQPLGEALLARPLPPPPPAVTEPAASEPKVEEPKTPEPRALISALIGPRYAGSTNILWGGASLGATLPFGPWGAGIWFRYDGPRVSFAGPVPSIQELSIGAAASRAFAVGPIELRAALKPAVGIVMRGKEHSPDGETHFTLRLGAEGAVMVPVHRTVRLLFALDTEISPLDISQRPPPPNDHTPRFPTFTLGLGAGLEVAIR